MESKLLITPEEVKNELEVDLVAELGVQPKQAERWLLRVQRTIINHVARYTYGGVESVWRRMNDERYKSVIKEAIIEQIDYLATNNYVQADQIMKTGQGQLAEPIIAPLAHQLLLNAGLLYTGA